MKTSFVELCVLCFRCKFYDNVSLSVRDTDDGHSIHHSTNKHDSNRLVRNKINKQAALSRATLEISSTISYKFPL